MHFIRKHSVSINVLLSFFIAILSGLWVNYFSSLKEGESMTDRQHLLLIIAILLLGAQYYISRESIKNKKVIIKEILKLGIQFFVDHSSGNVHANELRGFVHLCKKVKPGDNLPKQRCLVIECWASHDISPRDRGPISIDNTDFKNWYINVRAFHSQKITFGEPDPNVRPNCDDHYLNTSALFSAKTVISSPLFSRNSNNSIIGTLTFDSSCELSKLQWIDNGHVNESVKVMIQLLADLIGEIISDEKQDT